MIKTIIIDDEAPAREIVSDYLEIYPEIGIVAQCGDGFSGLKAIQEHKPELIFLDVQMPRLTGFEMLEVLEDKPVIIFTTAYDQHAIKAFEQNALDYLLKPFSEERFRQAVDRAIKVIRGGMPGQAIESLGKQMDEQQEILQRVIVKLRNEIRIIPVAQIYYFEAQDDYVMIYTENERFLKQKTLKFFEDHLDPRDFLRIHRSYIVRLDKIKKIEPYEKSNGIIILSNAKSLPVSRSGLSRLKERLDI